MKYFTEYETEEHMLYIKEITELFGLQDEQGKSYTSLVSALLKEIDKEEGPFPKYYYSGKLYRVYPRSHYVMAFKKIIDAVKTGLKHKDDVYYCYVNNKQYAFKVRDKNEYCAILH